MSHLTLLSAPQTEAALLRHLPKQQKRREHSEAQREKRKTTKTKKTKPRKRKTKKTKEKKKTKKKKTKKPKTTKININENKLLPIGGVVGYLYPCLMHEML